MIKNDNCVGCQACVSVCPMNCVKLEDNCNEIHPVVDIDRCIKCQKCIKVCQEYNDVPKYDSKKAFKGYRIDGDLDNSSSGGICSALLEKFISFDDNFICGCLYDDGEFKFKITNTLSDIKLMRGSKYVKSNLDSNIFKQLAQTLIRHKVLFVGLPCQVAAVLLYPGINKENLYTIDLICHGTPSIKLLNAYLNEKKFNLPVNSLKFREKRYYQLIVNDKFITKKGVQDEFMISFLSGMSHYDSCYNCKFASLERISDITLGDCYSDTDLEKKKRGLSTIIINSKKGDFLIKSIKCNLEDLDLNLEKGCNHQLYTPTKKPVNRKKYFSHLKKKGVSSATKKYLKKQYFKQRIKNLLLKLKIIKR